MAKQEKQKEGYISNSYLRELIVKFNNMNFNDEGKWCPTYLAKLEKKLNTHKIDQDKYNDSKAFILKKMEKINALREKYYTKFTDEERRVFNAEFDKLKADICEAFCKVIDGRIISFKLIASKDKEDINDIKQDALFTLFTYINRYDEDRNTSAFAFVTQLITNSILYNLNQMKERSTREVQGLDFYNNYNPLDDPHDTDNCLNNFMD